MYNDKRRYYMETIPELDRELERKKDMQEEMSRRLHLDDTNCGQIHRREWTPNNGYDDYDDEESESDGISLT